LDEIRSVEGVLEEPEPDVRVVDLGGSSVVIRGRWWTRPEQANTVAVQDEVVKRVKERLEAEDIDIPYPTRTVHLHEESGTG
ncbi:MAG: mechanosensitive ion channel family protein, partial [Gemmatimonadota bacterium]